MKLNREAYANYIDYTFGRSLATAKFEVIGDDIEEMAYELNPDTEQIKNILGETKTKDKGYQPQLDADPFYADPEKNLYKKIKEIAFDRLKGDECKTIMLEVIVEDTEAQNHLAYAQEVIVKPSSIGGSTEGVNIPFNVSEDGKRYKGYVTAASLATREPVFTESDTIIND